MTSLAFSTNVVDWAKGNINRKGERIYFLPFHALYGSVKIDAGRGERWFCSEDEAQQAGW